MTRTLLGVIVVGLFATVAVVGAWLLALGPATERVERVSSAAPEFVAVPVVLSDIPIGTKITAENVHDLFVFRQFPKDAVPPDAQLTLDELADKRTMRSLWQGEMLTAGDFNRRAVCGIPDGDVLMTVTVTSSRAENGFLVPGDKVVILATKKSEAKGKEVVLPLFLDSSILEVEPAKPGQDERQVSFAVTSEQSVWLSAAIEGGATIRIGLPQCGGSSAHETDTQIVRHQALSMDDLIAFLSVE